MDFTNFIFEMMKSIITNNRIIKKMSATFKISYMKIEDSVFEIYMFEIEWIDNCCRSCTQALLKMFLITMRGFCYREKWAQRSWQRMRSAKLFLSICVCVREPLN